ncbi:hypothetical protein [Rhodococcoides navarretei]|uniref:Uncharacterized protein n=1 Tax=Rhodococcus navarretei TaxID=3128981 RepID=A0ABU9D215_9NOCA
MTEQSHSRHVSPRDGSDHLVTQALQESFETLVLEQYSAKNVESIEGVFGKIVFACKPTSPGRQSSRDFFVECGCSRGFGSGITNAAVGCRIGQVDRVPDGAVITPVDVHEACQR